MDILNIKRGDGIDVIYNPHAGCASDSDSGNVRSVRPLPLLI